MSLLSNQAYCDGFVRGLSRQMEKGVEKSAGAAATAASVAIPAFRRKEMAALGERLLRESTRAPDVWSGLKAVVRPGYGQIEQVRNMRSQFARLLSRAHPADRQALQRNMQQQLEQAYAEIGAVAEPKINFWGKTVPTVAGVGAGAAGGMALGTGFGKIREQGNIEDRLQNMPLLDRLKYLVLPNSLNVRPQFPYELRRRNG
jgi:hypothetical protein